MKQRKLPSNPELEEAMLGCLLIDPQAIGRTLFLRPEDFKIVKNQWIHEAILSLHERGAEIDHVTILNELEACGRDVGGAVYLTRLLNSVPSALHAETYACQLVELATRREFIGIAADLAKAAYSKTPTEEIIVSIGKQLASAARGRSDFVSGLDLADEYYAKVEEWAQNPVPDGVRGMRVGLHAFDQPMGGLNKGELLVIASRPRVGKTALIAHVALKLALAGHGVILWEGEMNRQQIIGRMVSDMSGVPSKKARAGTLTGDEMEKYANALARIHQLSNLRISDRTGVTTAQLRADVLAMPDTDVVLVDHIRLFADKDDNEVRRLGTITWNLKQLAKDGIAVVAAAQLNRGLESRQDKRPRLHDIRASGLVEENADGVYGLYREAGKREIEIIVLKCREGEADSIGKVYFDPTIMRFGNLERG